MSDLVRRPAPPGERAVDRLLAAALEELRQTGYQALNVRAVARRAGVSPATAYNYFASKEHLFAAVNLQLIRELPPPRGDGPVERRIARLLGDLADALAPEPELRDALTAAMLGHDAASARVRDAIIAEFVGRFERACGDDLTGAARDTVLFAFAGAMVMAGVGRLPFADIEERVTGMVRMLR